MEKAANKMHSIQKSVPIPKKARPALPSRRKYPFHEMEVGDMFFVPGKKKNTMATHASTTGKKLGRKFVTRMAWMRETLEGWEVCDKDHEDAVQGIGVWRTE